MGRIYTPEQLVNGAIPEPGVHEAAGRYLLDKLFEERGDFYYGSTGLEAVVIPSMNDEDKAEYEANCLSGRSHPEEKLLVHSGLTAGMGMGIRAGMVYGSTVLGTAGRRSDLDVLVIFNDGDSDRALPFLRDSFRDVASRFKVVVEPNVLSVDSAHRPFGHSIDTLFLDHLVDVQYMDSPRWSYEFPADFLSRSRMEYDPEHMIERNRLILQRYASGKERQCTSALASQNPEGQLHEMQRALEIPFALGRKAFSALGVIPADPNQMNLPFYPPMPRSGIEILKDRSRSIDYLNGFFDTLSENGWHGATRPGEDTRRLSELDGEYSELLEIAIAGSISTSEYEKWLQTNRESALSLGRTIAAACAKAIADRQDQRNVTFLDEYNSSFFQDIFDIEDVY
jgi:hypothetical protein